MKMFNKNIHLMLSLQEMKQISYYIDTKEDVQAPGFPGSQGPRDPANVD